MDPSARRFAIDRLGRYFIHDPDHHLHDVRASSLHERLAASTLMSPVNHPALSIPCAKAGCGPLIAGDGPAHALCRGCGLVYRLDGVDAVIDAAATRSALFRAADACAGPDCSLQALAFNRYGSDPLVYDRMDRFSLAETGVASLARLGQ